MILDSPEGRTTLEREGGWVAAPVFHRVAQQVLEYLHSPHDLEIPANRQVLLAREKASEKDVAEGSPDHPGEEIDVEDAGTVDAPPSMAREESGVPARPSAIRNEIIPAAMREKVTQPTQTPVAVASTSDIPAPTPMPVNGTVVLDVEQGGIAVPSFFGQSVRSAIETAEANGLDLEIVGSGIAQDQSPPAGAHVPLGAKITVRFGR